MRVIYLCPHCRGAINAGNNIILSAKAGTNNAGLILLHEEIGNYTSKISATLTIEKGEIVDLYCPICHACLNIPNKDALAKYIRFDETCNECYIIISRKYGEKITFKVDENKHIETYGEKISRFIDPEWFT